MSCCLAATGMRASEALNIQIKDIDFDNKPAIIYVRGENTETKTDRIIFLNRTKQQINLILGLNINIGLEEFVIKIKKMIIANKENNYSI